MLERNSCMALDGVSQVGHEVVRLSIDGMSDDEIALVLGISLGDVRSHWSQIRSIWSCKNRSEIVAKFFHLQTERSICAALLLLGSSIGEYNFNWENLYSQILERASQYKKPLLKIPGQKFRKSIGHSHKLGQGSCETWEDPFERLAKVSGPSKATERLASFYLNPELRRAILHELSLMSENSHCRIGCAFKRAYLSTARHLTDADAVVLLEIKKGDDFVTSTHVVHPADLLHDVSTMFVGVTVPWLIDRVAVGMTVVQPDVLNFPPTASREFLELHRNGIRSVYIWPLENADASFTEALMFCFTTSTVISPGLYSTMRLISKSFLDV